MAEKNSWRDKVSNEMIRRQTGIAKLKVIITKRRLRWLGHVHRMDDNRISKQALNWSPAYGKENEDDQERTGKQQF